MARECATAASTECTLYNNQDQKYFTNREISGLCMNPSWQCSLAFKQCWPCTEGSTEVQLGSSLPWEQSGTKAAMPAAGRDHPQCPGSLSKGQGTSTPGPAVEPPRPPCQTLGVCRRQLWREPCLQLHEAFHHLTPSEGQLSQQAHHRKREMLPGQGFP